MRGSDAYSPTFVGRRRELATLRTALTEAHADVDRETQVFGLAAPGGSNFGVVTSFEYRMHPVGPMVAIAAPIHPVEQAPELLAAFREFAAAAPEQANTSGRLPYTAVQKLFDPFFPAGEHCHYWTSLYLDGVGDDAIAEVSARGRGGPSPKVDGRHLGARRSGRTTTGCSPRRGGVTTIEAGR